MSARIQAKHIPDEVALKTIDALQKVPLLYRVHGSVEPFALSTFSHWVSKEELHNVWWQIPPKVIRAKLRRLIKRELITGCTCGCRGDYELTTKGQELIAGM